jgi:hypothetical protein
MAFFGRRRFCIRSGRLSPAREDLECVFPTGGVGAIKHLFGESCHFTSTGLMVHSVPSGVGLSGAFPGSPAGSSSVLGLPFALEAMG